MARCVASPSGATTRNTFTPPYPGSQTTVPVVATGRVSNAIASPWSIRTRRFPSHRVTKIPPDARPFSRFSTPAYHPPNRTAGGRNPRAWAALGRSAEWPFVVLPSVSAWEIR